MNEQQGIQVAPLSQEPDVNMIRSVFDNALNSVIQATALAKQVEELAAKVQNLSNEVDAIRRNNAWLDEQLTRVRAERDEVISERNKLTDELHAERRKSEGLKAENTTLDAELNSTIAVLSDTRRDRDDYVQRNLDLEASLATALATIAKFKEQSKAILGLVEPEAKPQPSPYWDNPAPSPVPEVAEAQPEPAPYKPWAVA